MPKTFRPRNTDIVEAHQFSDLASLRGILKWLNNDDAIVKIVPGEKIEVTVMANNEHGNMLQQVRFRLTEWVVKVDGRFCVCNDETFRADYEQVLTDSLIGDTITLTNPSPLGYVIANRPEGAR